MPRLGGFLNQHPGVEPSVVYDAGFQLTVLATLGLPLLVPPIQRRLAPVLRGLRVVPAPETVAELLAVTLAAQLATLPVLALTFGQISLVAPLANLLTVPLLAPLLVLGGALALLGLAVGAIPLLGAAALAVGWVLWPLLAYVDAAIGLCAALPLAAIAVPGAPIALAWAYYAALAFAAWGPRPLLRRLRPPPPAASPAAPPMAPPTPSRRAHRGLPGVRVGVALLLLALLGALGAAVPALAAGPARTWSSSTSGRAARPRCCGCPRA